jgi:UDP-2-acetamido-2-deoxy-ribo-hexuluronate aminotransferase
MDLMARVLQLAETDNGVEEEASMDFIDLKSQYKRIEGSVQKRINDVLGHGGFIMGPEVGELEKRLASYVGVRHCISCSSGTDALLLSLMAYGVGPGDAVFTSTFTFISTAEVICLLGATPVFVDIDSRTFNLDPAELEMKIESGFRAEYEAQGIGKDIKPKGIIGVDLFGLPADYEAINRIAERHGLFVVEDAAQSFGATQKGKRAGSLAEVGATSFFPAKPLGCYGDGGAILTDNDNLAEKMKSLRVHGKGKDKYDNVRIGINGRLDTLQAGILLAKLDIFDNEFEARQEVAHRYFKGLKDMVTVPHVPEGFTSVWAQYSVVTEKRAKLMAGLKERGIPTAIYYPKPLHMQTAFSFLGYEEGSLPVSERISNTVFSLPMHPYLGEDVQKEIIDTLSSCWRKNS